MGIDHKNKIPLPLLKNFIFTVRVTGIKSDWPLQIVQLLNNFLQVQRRWPKAVSRVQVKAECSGKEKSSPHWLTYDENNCWLLLSLTGDRVIVIVIDYS